MSKFAIILSALLIVVAFSLGCLDKPVVQIGDNVSMKYAVYYNGQLLDNNKGQPLSFVVGQHQVIQGVELGVLGMKVGDNKTVTVEPKDGYGEWKPELVIVESIKNLTARNITAEVGIVVYSVGPTGRATGVITNVNSTHATIDFNHLLAGKTLTFLIKITDIKSSSK